MKNLSIERMEKVQGGSAGDCVMLGLGVGSIIVAAALVPATGGLSGWIYAGLAADAITTGWSGAGCLDTFM
jgi:hypothetical protein